MCICGKNEDFENCCKPIIDRVKAPNSAEELMRSRYSAYVKGDGAYLVFSSAKESQYEEDIPLIEEFANSVEWLGLEMLHVTHDSVEFKAYYKTKDGIELLHEKSGFVQEDGVWKYKEGKLFNTTIKRNDPCPCGSGKKYKKCCAVSG